MKKIFALLCLASLCAGCSKSSDRAKTDALSKKLDAVLQNQAEINAKLTESDKPDKSSFFVDWGSLTVSNTLTFTLKTEWKGGMLRYLLTVSPYEGLLAKQFEGPSPWDPGWNAYMSKIPATPAMPDNGLALTGKSETQYAQAFSLAPRFDIYFNDANGFRVQTVSILVVMMEKERDSAGRTALSVEEKLPCSKDDYESIKNWKVRCQNFLAEN